MTYSEPVARLIKIGRPDPRARWLDYDSVGIKAEHITELIRVLEDHEMRLMFPPDDAPEDIDLPEWYAQIHAWRALGQLRAEVAILPLLGILRQIDEDDDDWLSSDVDQVYEMIGGAAVGPLSRYLADEVNPMYARSATGSALAKIGTRHPTERDRCVAAIAAVLEKFEDNGDAFNGFLIGDLVELKAVERIDLINRAFDAEAVDEFINGDVEDVQIELGLLKARLTPPRLRWPAELSRAFDEETSAERQARNFEKKQKNKRKQEKKSRKKNRRRK
jgi:HEAT repeat protein